MKLGFWNKRQQFIIVVLLEWFSFYLWRQVNPEVYFSYGGLFILGALILIVFALRENMQGMRRFMLPALPLSLYVATLCLLTTLSIGSPLWYLVWVIYLPFSYIALLSVNIFGVASRREERSIPLLRAAHTTAFIDTVVVGFIFYSFIYNLPLLLFTQLSLVFGVTVLLVFNYFWTLSLEENVRWTYLALAIIAALLLTQAALVASFFPLKFSTRGLLLSTILYSLVGVVRYRIIGELTSRIMLEYGVVILLVLGLIAAFD